MTQTREMLSVVCGSPPPTPHLLSRLHRLNCIVASVFQECDSCPWPRLQINTTWPSLLSGLGRISARQERGDKERWGCFSSTLFAAACLTLPTRLWAVGLSGAGQGVPCASRVAPGSWWQENKGAMTCGCHPENLLGSPSGTEPGGEALATRSVHTQVWVPATVRELENEESTKAEVLLS